ncbi:MAG: VOC family protein [Coprobacillaceae bacterium]
MNCTITSLYLCVNDMTRAISFYEDFFEKEVTERNEIYSVFDINGFRLGLFAYKEMKEEHTFGNSCLPSLEVETLEILKNKLKQVKVVFELKQIGNNWVSEFEDSEGNHLELATPVRER